jgi:hypothetical protein
MNEMLREETLTKDMGAYSAQAKWKAPLTPVWTNENNL